MNKAVKGVLILYCLSIIGTCIYVPWEKTIKIVEGVRITKQGGYSFVWYPHKEITDWKTWEEWGKPMLEIDFSRILLEIIALTGIAGALVLIFWKKRRN